MKITLSFPISSNDDPRLNVTREYLESMGTRADHLVFVPGKQGLKITIDLLSIADKFSLFKDFLIKLASTPQEGKILAELSVPPETTLGMDKAQELFQTLVNHGYKSTLIFDVGDHAVEQSPQGNDYRSMRRP